MNARIASFQNIDWKGTEWKYFDWKYIDWKCIDWEDRRRVALTKIDGISFRCSQILQKIRYGVADILIKHPRLTLYSVISVFVMAVFCVFFLQTSPVLNAQSNHISMKYYTTIEIADGDTLWEIAQEYRTPEYSSIQDYMKEVREINHIVGDQITTGCYLTIPYYAEEPITKN